MWHGAAALLTSGEWLFGLEDFCALQVAKLYGPVLEAGGHQGQPVHEFGVDVPLDNLRGDGHWPQVQTLAHMRFHRRREVGMGTDGAAELA